jgi:hypothetical protein
MRNSNADSARRLGLVAVAAALAAGIVLAGRRLAQGRGSARTPSDETYRCSCGATYRVQGADRHRVYWREGAAESDAVLGDRCVECDAPLPAGHDTVVV